MAIEVYAGGDQNFKPHCETIAEADLIARCGGIELAFLEAVAREVEDISSEPEISKRWSKQ
jgi:hypothetical protein